MIVGLFGYMSFHVLLYSLPFSTALFVCLIFFFFSFSLPYRLLARVAAFLRQRAILCGMRLPESRKVQ